MDAREKLDLAVKAAASYRAKSGVSGDEDFSEKDSNYKTLWLRVTELRKELNVSVEEVNIMFKDALGWYRMHIMSETVPR